MGRRDQGQGRTPPEQGGASPPLRDGGDVSDPGASGTGRNAEKATAETDTGGTREKPGPGAGPPADDREPRRRDQ